MTVPAQDYTYEGHPESSLLDEVRFLLQDVGEGELWLLTDAEIQYLLDMWMPRYDSATYVASVAAGVVSRKFAGVVNITADGVSVDTADLSQRYRDLATNLRAEYEAGGLGLPAIESIMAGFEPDYSIAPLDFGVGMHDNPEAGRQAYGTRYPGWNADGTVSP